jgi:NADH-quinone oxidoreductase subunit A
MQFIPEFDLALYYPIFLYLIVVILFAAGAMIAAHLIGPKRNTPVKLMPYESGMDPVGDARQRFDVKFYLIAILFLVFDVELLFLYPWAVIAYREDPPIPRGPVLQGEQSLPARPVAYHPNQLLPDELTRIVFWEVIAFLATLVVAYIYAWRKGVFQWR